MLMHRPSSLLQVLLQGRLLRCTVQCQQSLPRLPGPRGEALVALPRCLLNTASESTHHAPPAPFRKQLKDAAKKQKVTEGVPEFFRSSNAPDTRRDKWELTVGIEIHAQLHTEHKLFSRAAVSVNDEPNSHVSVFDAALPGAQPALQEEALLPAIRAALALHCQVQRASRFDRKHYFYRDQPAGYQITQYYNPLAVDGKLELFPHDGIAPEDGESIVVGIKQIQLEQDTAKTLHQPPSTHLLDFNRVSLPLIEIITLPQIHHPATASACVRKMQATLKNVGACVLGMELGGLRADVNVSVRPRSACDGADTHHQYHGVQGLGQRTEIKNLSSLKAVEDAIAAERDRQIRVLESGGVIEGETRGWTLGSTETTKLRSKEGEVDYRYMPDPDLAPVFLSKTLIEHVQGTLPMSPDKQLQTLTDPSTYALTVKDAKSLLALDDGDRLDYYQEVVHRVQGLTQTIDAEMPLARIGRTTGNWLLHEVGGHLAKAELDWTENPVTAQTMADVLTHLLEQRVTGRTAKRLLAMSFNGDSRPISQMVDEEGLLFSPLSSEEYHDLAQRVVDEHAGIVRQVQEKGKRGKMNFLVGRMVRQGEHGRVEASKAEGVLRRLLGL